MQPCREESAAEHKNLGTDVSEKSIHSACASRSTCRLLLLLLLRLTLAVGSATMVIINKNKLEGIWVVVVVVRLGELFVITVHHQRRRGE